MPFFLGSCGPVISVASGRHRPHNPAGVKLPVSLAAQRVPNVQRRRALVFWTPLRSVCGTISSCQHPKPAQCIMPACAPQQTVPLFNCQANPRRSRFHASTLSDGGPRSGFLRWHGIGTALSASAQLRVSSGGVAIAPLKWEPTGRSGLQSCRAGGSDSRDFGMGLRYFVRR
jgi:hypothetical protein